MLVVIRCLAAALVALAAVSAHAQFQARDFNNDGTTDGWYDVAQDLTWLADANYAYTSGWWAQNADTASWGVDDPSAQGLLSAFEGQQWAAQLDVHGVTGWRLPVVLGPLTPNGEMLEQWGVPSGYYTDCSQIDAGAGSGDLCTGGPSEMAGLAGHTGLFLNLSSSLYWLGSGWQGASGLVFQGITTVGSPWVTFDEQMGVPLHVMAVRDGDVAPVPEPSTFVLMAIGLAVVVRLRKKAFKSEPAQLAT